MISIANANHPVSMHKHPDPMFLVPCAVEFQSHKRHSLLGPRMDPYHHKTYQGPQFFQTLH